MVADRALVDHEEPPSLSDYHDYEPNLEFDDTELQTSVAIADAAASKYLYYDRHLRLLPSTSTISFFEIIIFQKIVIHNHFLSRSTMKKTIGLKE